MDRLKKTIESLVNKLDEADVLFIDYIGRESLPIKNWRGQPAPISSDLEARLQDCVGTFPNTAAYAIKDAMEVNGLFMKKYGAAVGIDECRMVVDKYLKALMRIGGLKGNRSCEYGVVGNTFRMVKLATAAEAVQKDLLAIKGQLSRVKDAGDVERIIAEVVATEMSKYAGHVGGRHGKTTRRNKRRTRRVRRT